MVLTAPDCIPLDESQSTVLSACYLTRQSLHCLMISKRLLIRLCPVLSQLLGPAAAKQFLKSEAVIASLTPSKSAKITLDKTTTQRDALKRYTSENPKMAPRNRNSPKLSGVASSFVSTSASVASHQPHASDHLDSSSPPLLS